MGPTQPLFPDSLLHQSSLISSAGSPAACTMALHISPGLRRGHNSSHRWEKDRAPIAFHTWALPRQLLPPLLLPWCQPPRDGSAHTHHDHRSPSRGSPPVHLRNGFSCLQTGKAVRRPALAVVVHRGYIACNREQTKILMKGKGWAGLLWHRSSVGLIRLGYQTAPAHSYILLILPQPWKIPTKKHFRIWLWQNLGTPWNRLYKIRDHM